MEVVITSPSMDVTQNVSGISSVTSYIVRHNASCRYKHFTLGKADRAARNLAWVCKSVAAYLKWIHLMIAGKGVMIHFNLALDRRGLIRDLPLIIMVRLLSRRMIVHIHGGEFMSGHAIPGLLNLMARSALATGPIIVLSESERTVLSSRFSRAAIFVLPNCVDVPEAKAYGRTRASEDGLTVLFLGRITEEKGVGDIYHALQIAKSKHTKCRFVMAGAGPAEEVYVRQFTELLGNDFEFAGIVTGPEKAALINRCDVFLLPSLNEGLPMAMLECMAYGVVPIVTGAGSVLSVVRDGYNGVVIEKRSPGQIVEALEQFSANTALLQAFGQNARQSILDSCSAEEYVKQLNAIYSYDEHTSIPRCI